MNWENLLLWLCGGGILICLAWFVYEAHTYLRARNTPPQRSRHERATPPSTSERIPIPPPNTPASVRLGPPCRIHFDQPAALGGLLVRRGAPLVVRAHNAPYWRERGWQRNGNGYAGRFRVDGRQWSGMIEEPYPGGYKAYIWHPPLAELDRNTGHRPCFQNGRTDGRYEVHFHTMPASVDHAIAGVETVLVEALGLRP